MQYMTAVLPLAGRNRYEKQRVAKSAIPDTARQSTHRRKVRLVISVDDGLGCRLHPLQRLCQTPRPGKTKCHICLREVGGQG
jgi:hypothetical protein